MFVGTVPDYGILGGALAIYDAGTGQWSQHRNVVQDQSIIGLAYHNGKLYGGTSVWGGLGIDPKADEAKLFVWDVEKGEKIDEISLDIPGIDEKPRMIGDLSIGPDGNLWGAVDGTIFKMDPETLEILDRKMIRPSLYNSSKWFPYRLEWGPDGMLYTTLSRNLIAIDPETLNYKVLEDQFMNSMTVGVDGSIYYALGNELHKIAVPETDATLKTITINGEQMKDFSPGEINYTIHADQSDNIVAEATQPGAEVTINQADNRTIINVIGSDGKSTLTYTILWSDETVNPENPEEPTDPEEPGDPEESEEPGELEDPEDPIVPKEPVDSEQPIDSKGSDPSDGDKNNNKDPNISMGDQQDDDGKSLPSTATNIYNFLGIGSLLLLIGAGLIVLKRKKSNIT